VLLGLRVWSVAMLVRLLKHVVALPVLVRWMQPSRRASIANPSKVAALEAYLTKRGRFPDRPPGNCLDRGLAAYRLLCAGGSQPCLVIGIRPAERGLDGHVWVTLDGRPFGERANVDRYVSIVTFDARGERDSAPGTTDLAGIRWA